MLTRGDVANGSEHGNVMLTRGFKSMVGAYTHFQTARRINIAGKHPSDTWRRCGMDQEWMVIWRMM